MKKFIIAAGVALALAGCTQAAPAPVVTVTAPAPVAPTPTPDTNDFSQQMLREAWGTLSTSEKSDICLVFNVLPEEAWASFNEGAEGLVERSDFDVFFGQVCAAY